jgi:hypothetical protein
MSLAGRAGTEHPNDEFGRAEGWRRSWSYCQCAGHVRPPCVMYFTAHRLWDRFRDAPWQRIARRGLAPLTIGLAGGFVMARAGNTGWQSVVTAAAVGLMLGTRARSQVRTVRCL